MNKLQLIGSPLNKELLEHTKQALSDTLTPVKKTAIARSFLKRFLGCDTEHTLNEHIFESSPNAEQETSSLEVMCIKISIFEDNVAGGSLDLEDVETKLCTKRSHDKHLTQVIQTHFPDRDSVVGDVIDIRAVEGFIESQFDIEDEDYSEQVESYKNDLLTYDATEILEWLLDNFELYVIAEEFIPHLTMNYVQIESVCCGIED